MIEQERRSGAARPGAALERRGRARALRDVDLARRGRLLQAGAWGLGAGIITGFAATILLGPLAGGAVFAVMAIGAPALAISVSEGMGSFVGFLAHPGGRERPREYSHAESLVARGRYEDAVGALQAAILDHPEDPRPYVRIARLYRDHLGRPDDALRWFRRARDETPIENGDRFIVMREMLDLARKRLPDPLSVAPDLARHADRFQGTDEGAWAAAELAELRRLHLGDGSG